MLVPMLNAMLVFLGGGVGSVLRYAASQLAARAAGTGFPWGTLAVNLAGCLLIGLVAGLSERSASIGPAGRVLLIAGFLGGFTTFSAFGYETVIAARSGDWPMFFVNIAANNVLGLALVFAGLALAKLK